MRTQTFWRLGALSALGALLALSAPLHAQERAQAVRGVVQSADGEPLAGAVVRVQATALATTTDAQGRFALTGLAEGQVVTLTAWAPGYYIGGGEAQHTAGESDVVLTLEPHPTQDNPAYEWVSAYASAGAKGRCQHCHSAPEGDNTPLPFDEWVQDAHAQTAHNPRFLTMYTGTDVAGRQSPPTRYAYNRDYGRVPLPPDPNQPYYGPGYKLDFPFSDGNCAACHLPMAAVDAPYNTDPTAVSGVGAEGVGCDFCHKVWDVRLDPQSGLPYPNMPGVLSLQVLRPPQGRQLFFGPFDDVAPGEDAYSPLQRQSQFCAACHYGVFWGTTVYNSFGEWLASPYSDPQSGQTCQDCHMPSRGATHFVRLERGGLLRDPSRIASHRMRGATDVALLQESATLAVEATRAAERLTVTVTVTNSGAGHHLPTDSPLRQIFLVVRAYDAEGRPLPLLEGPTLPSWAGDLADEAGVYFAKLLEEVWTQRGPSGAYWNPTHIVEDTRLAALETRRAQFTFALRTGAPAVVEARLVYRRAFYALMEQKGWETPDIVMKTARVQLQ